MQTPLIAMEENVDVRPIAEVRRRAAKLPRGKITYHLVESRSIAGDIIDFARSNAVDHLITGAPTFGTLRPSRLSAQITADAPAVQPWYA